MRQNIKTVLKKADNVKKSYPTINHTDCAIDRGNHEWQIGQLRIKSNQILKTAIIKFYEKY